MKRELLPSAVRCVHHFVKVYRTDGAQAWHRFFVLHARCQLIALTGRQARREEAA